MTPLYVVLTVFSSFQCNSTYDIPSILGILSRAILWYFPDAVTHSLSMNMDKGKGNFLYRHFKNIWP